MRIDIAVARQVLGPRNGVVEVSKRRTPSDAAPYLRSRMKTSPAVTSSNAAAVLRLSPHPAPRLPTGPSPTFPN
jgi:hypothetical protein